MSPKLQAILDKLKLIGSKLYALSPFAAGVALGYWGKPLIKLALEAGLKLIGLLFRS